VIVEKTMRGMMEVGVLWSCVRGSKRGELEQCAKVLINFFFFFLAMMS
jgi:hypothetical protein